MADLGDANLDLADEIGRLGELAVEADEALAAARPWPDAGASARSMPLADPISGSLHATIAGSSSVTRGRPAKLAMAAPNCGLEYPRERCRSTKAVSRAGTVDETKTSSPEISALAFADWALFVVRDQEADDQIGVNRQHGAASPRRRSRRPCPQAFWAVPNTAGFHTRLQSASAQTAAQPSAAPLPPCLRQSAASPLGQRRCWRIALGRMATA